MAHHWAGQRIANNTAINFSDWHNAGKSPGTKGFIGAIDLAEAKVFFMANNIIFSANI
jgi:hypothetical protein